MATSSSTRRGLLIRLLLSSMERVEPPGGDFHRDVRMGRDRSREELRAEDVADGVPLEGEISAGRRRNPTRRDSTRLASGQFRLSDGRMVPQGSERSHRLQWPPP
jgi:hypothetical protein